MQGLSSFIPTGLKLQLFPLLLNVSSVDPEVHLPEDTAARVDQKGQSPKGRRALSSIGLSIAHLVH